MKSPHPLIFIPTLKNSDFKETIHVDMNYVTMITEPEVANRHGSGGKAEIYSWFKIVFQNGIPELVIRTTDIGQYTWEQVNELFAIRNEFPLASTRHLRKVFEAAYEAWTGKTYKIEQHEL
jgi:hypothetical protein